MPIMRRLALLLVMSGALMLAVGVGSAPAQAPSNDAWAGATVVSLPFSGTQDTTEATVGDDDLAAGAACGIDPGGGFIASHSVWYAFTPGSDGVVTLDASGSTYPVIGAVVTGTPEGGFASASCFLSSPTSFSVTAGQVYYADLLDSSVDGGGGTLRLSLTFRPRATAAVSVDGGSFDARTGAATVTGTGSCSAGAFSGSVYVSLAQSVGRIATIRGDGWSSFPCDGSVYAWSATVSPYSGKFKGGRAQLEYSYSACDGFSCAFGSGTAVIVLKR